MIKKLLLLIFGFIFIATASCSSALAYDLFPKDVCKEAPNSSLCEKESGNPATKTISSITTIVAVLAGIAAIGFIMFGGFKFITSNGDPGKAASGRMTVLYAVIGLLVIVIAQSLIQFIIGRLYG
jgi:Type IV secretion system pilin